MSANEWKKMSSEWWTCFRYDAWKANGVWYASFYCGPRFDKDFRSAAEAMRFCDNREHWSNQ